MTREIERTYRIDRQMGHMCKINIFIYKIDLFLTFVTETISRTDEGQPRPKYIFNNSINVELTSTFYSTGRGLVNHHHRILNVKMC